MKEVYGSPTSGENPVPAQCQYDLTGPSRQPEKHVVQTGRRNGARMRPNPANCSSNVRKPARRPIQGAQLAVGRSSGRLVSVSEPAQENPQSRSSPEMPTRIVTWLCRIPGLSVGGPDRQCRPPVRNGSEEDHFCGHGTSLAFPRTVLWLFMHACSHDSQGDCVPST